MPVRVNLFDPVRKPIYGTATPKDIFHVALCALFLCCMVGAATWGVTHLLIQLRLP